MKRFVGAFAVLLAFVGLSRADFVIIIYNLSAANQPSGGNGQRGGINGMMPPGGGMGGFPAGGAAGIGGGMGGVRPGGVAGGIPPGGAAGLGGGVPGGGVGGVPPGGAGGLGGVVPGGMGGIPPGGMGGIPPGGMGGIPPGGMGGSGRPPGGGTSGTIPQPGGFGGSGGPPPGGGTSGTIPQPGGFGGSGGPPPGGGTSGTIPQPGGFGGSGGPPGGMGGRGMLGAGGGGMGIGGFLPGGLGGGTTTTNFTPVWAIAIVEVDRARPTFNNPKIGVMTIHHQWSGANGSHILSQAAGKQITAGFVKYATVKQRWEKEHDKAYPGGKADLKKLPELAEWALNYNLLDNFVETMTKWAELEPKNEKVLAFQQVQSEMAKEVPDPAGDWRGGVLSSFSHAEKSPHYVLLHSIVAAARPPEVDSRLKRLEGNYRAFFYWFALQGKALPLPKQRLVAVLAKQTEEFKRQQQIFDAPSGADTDGFVARRENLAVFSLEPNDPAAEALSRMMQPYRRDVVNFDRVLHALPRMVSSNGKGTQEVPLALGFEIQTVALLERALKEDAEIASVTHEGTRQLLAATGQLPRDVAAPQWLLSGWGSFFGTPKGSPWMTVGAPSSTILPEYNYLEQYKAARKAGKLGTQKAPALIGVVTDQSFRELAKNSKSAEARVKSRTMAWSLVYFLANSRLDGLLRYHEELKKLPRDMEFDSNTLLLTFARAFDCLDAAQPNTVDMNKLEKLATAWDDYIGLARSDHEKLVIELQNAQNELKTKQAPKPEDKLPSPSP